MLVPVRGPFIRIVFFTAGRGGGIRVSGLGLLAACVDTANCLQVTVGFLLIHLGTTVQAINPTAKTVKTASGESYVRTI